MTAKAGEHVVAVLPDRLCDDERAVRIDRPEDVHAHPLAADEAVARRRVGRMAPDDAGAVATEGCVDVPLELDLGGPAESVGSLPEVAAGDEGHLAGHRGSSRPRSAVMASSSGSAR